MATALYDVFFRRPDANNTRLGVVHARRAVFAGNWFSAVADIMTPDMQAVRASLPHYHRPAFDRYHGSMWHTEGTLHASMTLRGSRGRVLGTIHCEGYER